MSIILELISRIVEVSDGVSDNLFACFFSLLNVCTVTSVGPCNQEIKYPFFVQFHV